MSYTERRISDMPVGASLRWMFLGISILGLLGLNAVVLAGERPRETGYIDASGTAHVPKVEVPISSFMSPEARRSFVKLFAHPSDAPPMNGPIGPLRSYYHKSNLALVARDKARYAVLIRKETIAGVPTEVVVPKDGISPGNKNRVLMNLHGGGFLWGGGGVGGELESIPVAAVGKIEVVAVAYRQGPEYKFPAASEDAAAVYRALLRRYPAKNIGIYGCSAGGMLTAESMAWFEKVKLPLPGAIGTFCGSASPFGGDSAYVAPGLMAQPPLAGSKTGELSFSPYFSDVSLADPLVFPTKSKRVLAKFPPTLLIAGSRDFSVSSLFHTQEALTSVGVDAELHVWDGMWHAFFMDPDLPESRQVYKVIVGFFDRHLGRRPLPQRMSR